MARLVIASVIVTAGVVIIGGGVYAMTMGREYRSMARIALGPTSVRIAPFILPAGELDTFARFEETRLRAKGLRVAVAVVARATPWTNALSVTATASTAAGASAVAQRAAEDVMLMASSRWLGVQPVETGYPAVG